VLTPDVGGGGGAEGEGAGAAIVAGAEVYDGGPLNPIVVIRASTVKTPPEQRFLHDWRKVERSLMSCWGEVFGSPLGLTAAVLVIINTMSAQVRSQRSAGVRCFV
jgi:hypothetical protein